MPFIAPKILRFQPATTPDIVGYRVRIIADGQPFAYEAPSAELTGLTADPDGFIRADIAALPIADGLDGTYDVYVTAYDDNAPVANESDPLEVPDAVFDFSAPDAPTGGAIES
jgi:hypothetical protein